MRSNLHLFSLFLLVLVAFSFSSSACIGLVAGKVSFNVSAGGNQTRTMQVFNSCTNQSVYYTTFAQVNPKVNMTSPTVTTSPKNGTLAPRQNLYIGITVSMPYNAIPGTSWSAGAAVSEASGPPAAGGGATLNVGVVKLFGITALPPIFNPLPYAIGGGIAAGLAVAGGLYYYLKVAKKGKKPAKKAAAKRATARKRKTTKRKAGRKSARRRSSRRTSRRRRR